MLRQKGKTNRPEPIFQMRSPCSMTGKIKKLIFSEYEVAILGNIFVLMFQNSMAMMLIID